MIVIVKDVDGTTAMSYDTDKNKKQLCPSQAEKIAVLDALIEAAAFLDVDLRSHEHHVNGTSS